MRNIFKPLQVLSVLLMLCFASSSCFKDKVTTTYTIYTPIYKTKAAIVSEVALTQPRDIHSAGKLYLQGNYIFLSEPGVGVHVIDNANPAAPKVKGFIPIPANLDIAVKGTTLYADLYNELIAIDLSNLDNVKVTARVPNIFPDRGWAINYQDTSQVLTGYSQKDTTIDGADQGRYRGGCARCPIFYNAALSSAPPPTVGKNGTGGSMARFALVNDYLYALGNNSINVLNVSEEKIPKFNKQQVVGWNIETLFPFQDKLFVGSTTGMFQFGLSDPGNPVLETSFSHARACDPVIADSHYAYVTLHSNGNCGPANPELDVVDISIPGGAVLAKSYPMSNPSGLSKNGDLLFVCDGDIGLKILDAADPLNIKELGHISLPKSYDVIALSNDVIVVASDGLYQYRVDNSGKYETLSKINIK